MSPITKESRDYMKKQIIDKVFSRMTRKKLIHEGVLHIEHMRRDFSYCKKYGDVDLESPFLIASITKLYTTACILICMEQGRLSLKDPLLKFFSENTLRNLHLYKKTSYSSQLTLYHLLHQTSGLPDINEEGISLLRKDFIHTDRYLDFDEIIDLTKQQNPHFPPSVNNRAHYACVNFDILGKVLETITQLPLHDIYKRYIFTPLNLTQTYLPESTNDVIPKVYYKNTILYRPKFIRSAWASGGIISNARELMIFIKAFFNGKLFNPSIFDEVDKTYKLQFSMFPIRYGAGFMYIPLGGLANLFMGKGELLGHSGSTGSFAFFYPRKDMFFVGNLNQVSNSSFPVRLAMQLAMSMK